MKAAGCFGRGDIAIVYIILASYAVISCLSACVHNRLSSEQRTLLIRQLDAAEDLDEKNTRDAGADVAETADSVRQAAKAHQVVRKLQQGYRVSQQDVDDALDVPPKSLSSEAREQLIKELQNAKRRDEWGVQYSDPANDWLAWKSYREQEDRASDVLKALQRGKDVPWSEIKQALQIPESR